VLDLAALLRGVLPMSDWTMLHRIERVPELNGCSAKAIAVWSMLHHALDKRGRLVLAGVAFEAVLGRRLAVQTADRQWFYAALRELAQARAFRIEGDEFVLAGHRGATLKEGPKRTRKASGSSEPPSDLPETSLAAPANLPETSSRPISDLSTTSIESVADLPCGSVENHSNHETHIIEEEKRKEERREESRDARERGSLPLSESSFRGGHRWDPRRANASLTAKVFRRLWETAAGAKWDGPTQCAGSPPEAIDRWAECEGMRAFCTAEEVLECTILRWSEDEWRSTHLWPWPSFAKRYLECWRPEDLAVRFPAKFGRDPLRGALA
jgi:hypothetical protein